MHVHAGDQKNISNAMHVALSQLIFYLSMHHAYDSYFCFEFIRMDVSTL